MSITITGGISLGGGGWTIVAPPSVATVGYFVGGQNPGLSPDSLSTLQRITFATDTATATLRGTLNTSVLALAGTGTLNDGWFGGGLLAGSPRPATSIVQRITYATDTATAVLKGNLNQAKFNLSAIGDNTTYGWFIGGATGPSPTSVVGLSSIDRITFATDTGTASVRGPMSSANYAGNMATTDITTYAWFAIGKENPAGYPASRSSVNRITYATDTATPSNRGPLSSARYSGAASGTVTYGWYAAGVLPAFSTVDRITYATDTATATTRGPLASAVYRNAAVSDSTTYGWYGGGAPGPVTTVQRITFATDTAAASIRGPLASIVSWLAGSSGLA